MHLGVVDLSIVIVYMVGVVILGMLFTKRTSKSMYQHFLGGNVLPWWAPRISNASGMFDVAGTMLLVYWLTVYGMKTMRMPWLWPVFNQIFGMIYLSAWLRRSNVMTGAEWIKTRFGTDKGATLSNIVVVIFALIGMIGFLSYGFKGIGKFAMAFLPAILTNPATLLKYPEINGDLYGLILMGITTIYVVKGDMFNVALGIVWQITLMAALVYLVIRDRSGLIVSVIIMLVTSAILKINWWDKLEAAFGVRKEAADLNLLSVELAGETK